MKNLTVEHFVSNGEKPKRENLVIGTLLDFSIPKKNLKKNEAENFIKIDPNSFSTIQEAAKFVSNNGGSISHTVDIFYKTKNGYIRIGNDGSSEFYTGDGKDGKEILHKPVSFWKYFSNEEVVTSSDSKCLTLSIQKDIVNLRLMRYLEDSKLY